MRTKFDFSKKKSCQIKSLVLRETNGKDEELALQRALARGSDRYNNEELLRCSIVAVDDAIIAQPFMAMDKWSSRTRTFATLAFEAINGVKKTEAEDFLEAAEALPDEPSTAGGNVEVI